MLERIFAKRNIKCLTKTKLDKAEKVTPKKGKA